MQVKNSDKIDECIRLFGLDDAEFIFKKSKRFYESTEEDINLAKKRTGFSS